MAYYDRDYYRDPTMDQPPLGGQLASWSITVWLIAINVAVFVIDPILDRFVGWSPLFFAGHFSADTAILHGQIWRFITFQFLHAHIGHILINMLLLYFFGRFVEQYLGSRRFIGFYLLCGVAGAVGYMLLWGVGLIVSGPKVPLLGASAGVFGVLIGTAMIAPNARLLLFFVFPIQVRTFALIVLGIAAFVVLAQGNQPGSNAGGEAAHLGGAALGALLIRNPRWLDFCDRWFGGRLSPSRLVQRTQQTRKQQRAKRDQAMEKEVDRILEKVNQHGLHSLSRKEKRTLQKATEQRRGV